jgi:predicted dehydrogenase
MLSIGVFGAGYLGKIHIKCIGLADEVYELAGFYDPDDEAARQAQETFGIKRFDSIEALLDAVDVADIVTPTPTHFALASEAIRRGKHIFIEKPLTHTLAEAEELIRLSTAAGVKVQVGHVERFNPALLALGDTKVEPMFVEAHRLSVFNPRGADVSVVLDLMIHDLDIVLSLVRAPVLSVSAGGVAVVSDTPDIANARIEFANGCVANLTASRISLKQMRKVRLFQRDAYISLDFLEKQAQVIQLHDKSDAPHMDGIPMMELPTATGTKVIQVHMPPIEPVNSIKMELESFAQSILRNSRPRVSIEDGYEALKLAYRIIEDIEQRQAAADVYQKN